jgi:type IV pilus assembly protein PilA
LGANTVVAPSLPNYDYITTAIPIIYRLIRTFTKILKDTRRNKLKSLLKRIKSIRGFTLVELLVVIAIIGVLAAIIIPNVSGLSGSGQTEAAAAEKATLQAAMDTMMAKTGLTTVGAISSATSSMSAFPDATHPLYPNYLRSNTTKGTYTCNTTGLVVQATTGY